MTKFSANKNLLNKIKSMSKAFNANNHIHLCEGCPLEPLRHIYRTLSCRDLVVSISNYSSKPVTKEVVAKTISHFEGIRNMSGCATLNHYFLANMDFNKRKIKI